MFDAIGTDYRAAEVSLKTNFHPWIYPFRHRSYCDLSTDVRDIRLYKRL
jgi:hypothetical protein